LRRCVKFVEFGLLGKEETIEDTAPDWNRLTQSIGHA
jgi:hypothetical protein